MKVGIYMDSRLDVAGVEPFNEDSASHYDYTAEVPERILQEYINAYAAWRDARAMIMHYVKEYEGNG